MTESRPDDVRRAPDEEADLAGVFRSVRRAVALWMLMLGSLFGAVFLGPGPGLAHLTLGALLVVGSALFAGALAFAGEHRSAGALGGLLSGAFTLLCLALSFHLFGPFSAGSGPLLAFFPGPLLGWHVARWLGRRRREVLPPTVF
ncbi:MAG: hypothetical protein AAF447_02805 [Myxococcota bacterium]